MSKKYITLSDAQKDEIRRLSQKANRRVEAFTKEYEKYGIDSIPLEVSGGIQTRKQWQTKEYAFSRKVTFETKEDYMKQLRKLRKFDNKSMIGTVKEYTEYGQERTVEALMTVTRGELSEVMEDNIRKMSAGQLAHFWDEFERRTIRLGQDFSSDILASMLNELFPEDIGNALEKSAERAQNQAQLAGEALKAEKKSKKRR